MKIRFIRHGDPDYVNDTLTEKGRVEAALLAKAVPNMELGDCYMSPLGRAMDTAAYSLAAAGKDAKSLDWLREFPAKVDINSSEFLQRAYPDTVKENGRFRERIVWDMVPGSWALDWLREFPAKVDINSSEFLQRAYPDTVKENGRFRERIVWDMVPGSWAESPEYSHPTQWRESEVARHGDLVSVYDKVAEEFDERIVWDMVPGSWAESPEYSHPTQWRESEVARHGDLVSVYDKVAEEFDRLLLKYGYEREGNHYRVVKENEQTITLFCHFGVTCVLLSRLWSVSPFVLWHTLALAPTSVTEVTTEEREKGIAFFRAARLGDISHLYAGGEEPSFACRFCETFGWEIFPISMQEEKNLLLPAGSVKPLEILHSGTEPDLLSPAALEAEPLSD